MYRQGRESMQEGDYQHIYNLKFTTFIRYPGHFSTANIWRAEIKVSFSRALLSNKKYIHRNNIHYLQVNKKQVAFIYVFLLNLSFHPKKFKIV